MRSPQSGQGDQATIGRRLSRQDAAIGDQQARGLLESPNNALLKGKRDRAILETLLYHALRREELCKLLVKDFKHERREVAHLKVSGKGGKTRYIPLHPAAGGLILEYVEELGHGTNLPGPLFRPIRNKADIAKVQEWLGHANIATRLSLIALRGRACE